MDELISREELKKHKFLTPQYIQLGGRRNGKTIERITLAYQKGWNDAIDAIYDNAPTVEQPTADYVCEKCKYVDRSVHEFPCNECAYAYENHFTEVKGGEGT